jgi:hypothetical protein
MVQDAARDWVGFVAEGRSGRGCGGVVGGSEATVNVS